MHEVMANAKVPSRKSPGQTDKIHEKSNSVQPVTGRDSKWAFDMSYLNN